MAENETQKKPRRSGSETRRTERPLSIRLRPEERAEVDADAARSGLSLGAYIRSRLLAVQRTRPRRRPAPEIAALAKIIAELNKGGSNVNQIAKHLNSDDTVLDGEISEALKEWRQAVRSVLAVMGRVPS